MGLEIVVGTQWGDEGKGKIVDHLAADAELVARCQGGPNAGHTVVVDGETTILHLIPSGALRPETRCLIGSGVVIDPRTLLEEVDMLAARGVPVEGRLTIDPRAHVILPIHARAEAAEEKRRGNDRIGTTMRGIGPAYEAKMGRRGVRIVDLLDEETLRARLRWVCNGPAEEEELVEPALAAGERLRDLVGDVSCAITSALGDGRRVLVECAQGTFLDVDHGTYPYVTSSSTIAGGALTGLGIGPGVVDRVLGVTKAYATRVGMGPFPGELEPEEAASLREAGAEYGATTGRPRRCGWLDLVALRRAARLNGLDALAVTKLDVLDGRDYVKVIVEYEADSRGDWYPDVCLEAARPVVRTLPGWQQPTSEARALDELPSAARAYLDLIADQAGLPVTLVSVGSGRDDTLVVPPSRPALAR